MTYLQDIEFLKKLDYNREKETYARIIALNNLDNIEEVILGRITNGSINIDGKSAIRRTCSLSMVALDTDTIITDTYWSYNNKFKLEIGLKNLIDSKYDDIVWFDMGIYIITSFSKSRNTSNLSINLSGKDKMCRLNGDVSGSLPMSTDFGIFEEFDLETNTTILNKIPIKDIIKNALIQYGQERPENIIINDLDQWGYELWEYRGNTPMYYIIDASQTPPKVVNITFDGDIDITENNKRKTISEINQYYSLNTLDSTYNDSSSTIVFNNSSKLKQNVSYWFADDKERINNSIGLWETIEYQQKKDSAGYDLYIYLGVDFGLKDFQEENIKFIKVTSFNTDTITFEYITSDQTSYKIAKIEGGQTAGYHRTPLVYNTDLVLNAGDNLTTLLDKLKNMLGDFEYFYDLEGHFVFQKKKAFIQQTFSPINGEVQTPIPIDQAYSYKFIDNTLFTSISNTPNINNVKNEFSIWGTRKSVTGKDLPIHARYAIDKKPIQYKSREKKYSSYKNWARAGYREDWPGWLIKMPLEISKEPTRVEDLHYVLGVNKDYNNEGEEYWYTQNDIDIIIDKLNSTLSGINIIKDEDLANLNTNIREDLVKWFCFTDSNVTNPTTTDLAFLKLYKEYLEEGQKYERTRPSKIILESCIFTTDSSKKNQQGYKVVDWREIIYQMAIDYYQYGQESDFYIKLETDNDQYLNGRTGYEQYYSDLLEFWRQLYNPCPTKDDLRDNEYYSYNNNKAYWNTKIHIDPGQLNFWFDFLDTNGEIGKYSINKITENGKHQINIGIRSKVANDPSVKSILYKEIPEVLFFVTPKDTVITESAYTSIQIQENLETLFYKSSQGVSAIAKANEFIEQYSSPTETISLTSIPIYYLEPNTRIYVKDEGDFILDKITYSLAYNGTMQLNGTKITQQFI